MNSGRKIFRKRLHQLLAHLLVGHLLFDDLVALEGEAELRLAPDQLRADVGGHDDDGVAEVHLAAAGIGQMASSMICSSMLWASGCAFSTSSKTTIE